MESKPSAQSQAEYRETRFELATWEVIGQAPRGVPFEPMNVEVLPTALRVADTMFPDFGGYSGAKEGARWQVGTSEQQSAGEAPVDDLTGKHILSDEELQQLLADSRASGAEAARAEFAIESAARLEALAGSLSETIRDLGRQVEEGAARTAHLATELAVNIGKKIVGHAVEINPEYIVEIIREALKLSGGAVVRKVRVSEQDMEFITVVGVAKQLKEYDGTWEFEADPTVQAGCIVQTSAGEIDFDLDKAWERVRDQVVSMTRKEN